MKINKKLSEIGFSEDTINSLTESQIDQILGLLLGESKKENKEATTKVETTKVTEYQPTEVQTMMKQGQGVNVSNGEVTPTSGGGLKVLQKSGKSEAPKNKVIKDGEMSEGKKKKKSKYNPWAICTSSVGREDKEKYEKCVMDVKKSIKEGKDPINLFLEEKIVSLLEKHVQPKISKKEFIEMISETETAPAKPKEKEKERVKPKTPFSPKPGVKPAPKAKKKETNEAETAEPIVKPKTPTTKPKTPFSPKPGIKPAPKAGKKSVPTWLKWDNFGLKF